MPNRDLTLTLNVRPGTTSGVGQMLAGAGKQLAQGTGLGDQFGQAIHRQQEQLNFMRFASQPDAIRRQAVQTLRMQDARERYEQRMQDELQRLRPGFGDKAKGGGGGFPQMAGFIGSAAGGNLLSGAIGLAGPWGAVIAGVVEGLSKLWGFLKNAVGLSNPAAMTRYNTAWDDLAATVGQKLTPAIDAATGAVRLFADNLQSIPGLGNYSNLSPGEKKASNLAILGEASLPVAIFTGIKDALGLTKEGSSIGAAARPAQFTSLDEYSKRAYREAYSSGSDPAQETAQNTAGILDRLDGLLLGIKAWWGMDASKDALQGLQ